MDESLSDITEAIEEIAPEASALLADPWPLYQGALILVLWIASRWRARAIMPVVESRARAIKGNPDLLRLVIAFMRRLHWVFLIVALWVARFVIRLAVGALPGFENDRTWLLSMALTLATAWLIIAVLTRIIRNRTLARIVAISSWSYIALAVVGLDHAVLAALDSAAIQLGRARISLLLVLKAVALTAALVWLAVFLGNMVSNRVERSEDLSPSFKVLIGKLIKIAFILLAGAVALSATGVDLTALTVFSGAVGVGIGFGLQKVVSNFIAGIIILLDKSIKPGDTISLGETFGWIRDLRSRFVSVITRDGREYLIPNEDFITERVVNWSFSSEYVRIDVDFRASYDDDPHEVVRIAIDTAQTIERVSDHRAPVCWLMAFGPYSLDYRLRFWISDPRNGLTNVRGQVLMALWDAFKTAGIKVPFPLREVVLRSPGEAVRVSEMDPERPSG